MVVDAFSNYLASSQLFAGCIMIVMNLGGRYISMDVPDNMQSMFSHPWIRKVTIFAIAFMATRSLKASILLTLLFILLTRYLLNEKSKCCIIKVVNNEQKTDEKDNR